MQIYEEAECKRNLFILPRREQCMWPLAKYTKKPRGMETNLSDFHSRGATVYMTRWRQIYEEAECKRNLFILPRRYVAAGQIYEEAERNGNKLV